MSFVWLPPENPKVVRQIFPDLQELISMTRTWDMGTNREQVFERLKLFRTRIDQYT